MTIRSVLIPGLAVLALGACETSYSNPFGGRANVARPLPGAPVGAVGQSTLPPLDGLAGDPLAPQPGSDGEMQVAAAGDGTPAPMTAPAGGGPSIGRTDLLGGWTVASVSDNCQLFMSLTSWSGGYRATTRGCVSESLQGVSAWNLEGRQVTLLNNSGIAVARLTAASKTQFNGQMTSGEEISVSR